MTDRVHLAHSAATETGSGCGLAVYWSMRLSISGRKWRSSPCTGQAAPSPKAQMVWPSIWVVTSQQHVDFADSRVPDGHAVEHPPHPAHAFAARRALAAALVLVEIGNARHRFDDVVGLVHDDHRGGAERRFLVAAAVEIHQQRIGLIGACRHQRHRRAAGDHREQIIPAAAHAAGMPFDQFAQRNAHRPLRHCTAARRGRKCNRALCRYCSARPMPANHAAPRRMMSGTWAMVSTLLTVVGQP